MPDGAWRYCDLSLPVPVDQAFTYELPLTLRHRVKPGCRVLVPFGPRKMSGVVVRVHDEPPEMEAREVLRLLDPEPVLDEALLALGKWIAAYYCAPLGETLRAMLPLAAATRSGTVLTLSDSGRDAARQLLFAPAEGDVATQILQALDARPLSEAYVKKKFPLADRALKSLVKRGFIVAEQTHEDRDPLRSPSDKLRVERLPLGVTAKLPKAEREILAFLELHPGTHNLADLEHQVKGASTATRSLGRRGLVRITREPLAGPKWDSRPPHALNASQQAAFNRIETAIAAREFKAFLLHGVTGSGKTEVYLNAIDAVLAAGRTSLLMVPEIALTPAMAGQFFSRFGDRVAILHSAFTDSERAEQWRRLRAGDARVVVGTRSGVFAPVRDLGLIIVDEEHDQSYKQEETPRYHGRDVALVRAQQAGACVILGSATPSLESRHNADRGKYELLEIPERVEARAMPQVELIDMRIEFLETRQNTMFSRRLGEAIEERVTRGEQVIVLLNRRGFSSFVACRSCGERVECINCSVTLTYHKRDRRLLCHYCGYAEKIPQECPKCGSEHVYFAGVGSEKVEEELHRLFPRARIARLDRDTAQAKRQFESILQGFREGSYDILTGTQMIAKGHDIPNVTLVGVVSADVGLGLPDFRAAERTFQLLTQVAGRAGRGTIPGQVLIQTINPDHYAIRHAAAQDYAAFYNQERQFRQAMHYPPFTALANVLVRHEKQETAMRLAGELAQLLAKPEPGIKIIGPAEAPVLRLKADFRYQMLIKSINRKTLGEVLRRVRQFALDHKWPATSLVIDVDPLTLL